MSVRGFVIHLERATQRRANVDRLVATAPVPTEVFPAVDGRAMSEAEVAQVYSTAPLVTPRYPFQIGRGEIACFLSHRAIWHKILTLGLEAALILEDDVDLRPDFPAAFAMSRRYVETFGYIQFQTRHLPVGRVLTSDGTVSLIRPTVLPLRTSAQLVSRAAASRLLDLTEQFDRPIDTFLQMTWLSSIPFACVRPSGVSDLTEALGGTVAQRRRRRSLGDNLVRIIQRGRYRSKIAWLSRRRP